MATTTALPLEQDKAPPFRKIGFGQCGLVFGRAGQAIKIARKGFAEALWNDMQGHVRVCKAFAKHKPKCLAPLAFEHVSKENTAWWSQNLHFFDLHRGSDFILPAAAIVSQRILPLPEQVRSNLIERYCPENLKMSALASDPNRDCLARVYLGKYQDTNSPLAPNFTLRNFNLHLDQMLTMRMPVNDYAVVIGQALAIVHWSCFMDGYDVEFVLGSEPGTNVFDEALCPSSTSTSVDSLPLRTNLDNPLRCDITKPGIKIWILDFNLCTMFDTTVMRKNPDALIQQLVFSFFENDPYYPLPLQNDHISRQLWEEFRGAYLREADKLIDDTWNEDMKRLPARFIAGCISREKDMVDAGKGHGYRENKG